MLYKDKFGAYWKKEDVDKLSETELQDLKLEETPFDERYLFM